MHCILFLIVESDIVCQAYLHDFQLIRPKAASILVSAFNTKLICWYFFFTWWWWWWYFFTCFTLVILLSNVLSRFQFWLRTRLLFKSEAQGHARAASAAKQDVHFSEYREGKAGGSHGDRGNDDVSFYELRAFKNQSFNIIPPARSKEIIWSINEVCGLTFATLWLTWIMFINGLNHHHHYLFL